MQKNQLMFFCLLLLLGSIGCAPVYYPTTPNPTLFQEKGEAIANLSISGSSLDINGAIAVSDNIAIAGGFNKFTTSSTTIQVGSNDPREVGGSNGTQFDIAPGVFAKLSDNFIFETYVGYGLGKINSDDFVGNVNKLILQPSIGYRNEAFETAFTYRQVFAKFDNTLVEEFPNSTYGEPHITTRFFSGRFKLTTQFGVVIPLKEIVAENKIFHMAVGMSYRFGGDWQ